MVSMGPKLEAIDLNLLLALDALLADRHVTRAAARMGLTQSAMSSALARLRELFGDPLLVRRGREMVKTAFAERLEGPLRSAFDILRGQVLSPGDVQATAPARRFVATMSDYGTHLVLPRVLERMRHLAPDASLWAVADNQVLPAVELSSGAVDLSVGFFWDPPSAIELEVLFTERLVCLVPRKILPEGPLTIDAYTRLPHVLVSQTGVAKGHVDKFLNGLGLQRRVVAAIPHFHAAAEVARACDAVVTLPRRLVRHRSGRSSLLRVVDPPFELPEWPVTMLWHRGSSGDRDNRWLREQVRAACAPLRG
jgi:DNA-binding transcriptional LysR family regulator